MKASESKIEEIISEYITDENVKNSLLDFVEWLKTKEITPLRQYFEGQSPFWEIEYNGKKHYIVWNGEDNICIMIKAAFTHEFQAVILENNLRDIVLDNLQYCSRTDGGPCNNCHLSPDVAGVDEIIFGKEVKNLCCGQFISFDMHGSETIEGIKKLLEL